MTSNNRIITVLIGAIGAGRTSVGSALAAQLDVELSETENLISEMQKLPFSTVILNSEASDVAQLAAESALAQLQAGGPDRVVTLLPMTLGDPDVREQVAALAEAGIPVLALQSPVAELARRAGLNAPRSVALGQPRGMFTRLVSALTEQFNLVGAEPVDTMGRVPEEVAAAIIEEYTLD